jgi:hypothetical protein
MRTRSTPLAIVFLSVAALSACTWVEPTEEGYAVRFVAPDTVKNCKSLGVATAEVPDSIGPIPRNEDKLRRELITLGKNQAAKMGGDTMAAVGPPFQGEQQFRVYQCMK